MLSVLKAQIVVEDVTDRKLERQRAKNLLSKLMGDTGDRQEKDKETDIQCTTEYIQDDYVAQQQGNYFDSLNGSDASSPPRLEVSQELDSIFGEFWSS